MHRRYLVGVLPTRSDFELFVRNRYLASMAVNFLPSSCYIYPLFRSDSTVLLTPWWEPLSFSLTSLATIVWLTLNVSVHRLSLSISDGLASYLSKFQRIFEPLVYFKVYLTIMKFISIRFYSSPCAHTYRTLRAPHPNYETRFYLRTSFASSIVGSLLHTIFLAIQLSCSIDSFVEAKC